MRTFVAINLPRELRARMISSLDAVRDRGLPVRWAREDALHLTLKFLGEIEGSEVQRLDDTLRAVAARHAPQAFDLSGLGAFPSRRRAAVVWVGVAATPPLLALQRDLELALSRLGYAREQKPFRPHITVGRAQGGARPPDIERAAAAFQFDSRAEADTIDLMRSHLEPAGARYEPLLRIPLGGAGEP